MMNASLGFIDIHIVRLSFVSIVINAKRRIFVGKSGVFIGDPATLSAVAKGIFMRILIAAIRSRM